MSISARGPGDRSILGPLRCVILRNSISLLLAVVSFSWHPSAGGPETACYRYNVMAGALDYREL